MTASSRIPPIAQPFVSEQAKRTLDLVIHSQYPTSYRTGTTKNLLVWFILIPSANMTSGRGIR